MARDPLPTLLRLRRLAHDEARRALTEAVAREAAATDIADAIDREIGRETTLASSLDTDDAVVERFGLWLTGARHRAAAARAHAERLESDTARARAAMTLARAGVEAVESLAADRAAADRDAAMRREQHALDDLARRKREP